MLAPSIGQDQVSVQQTRTTTLKMRVINSCKRISRFPLAITVVFLLVIIGSMNLIASDAANVRGPHKTAAAAQTSSLTNSNNNEPHHQQALNYLLFSSSLRQPHDAKLEELLKDSNHSHVSDAINLPLANSVWRKMHQNALEYAQQRADETKPTINRLLEQANVSEACKLSVNNAIDRLAKLDEWAVKSKCLHDWLCVVLDW